MNTKEDKIITNVTNILYKWFPKKTFIETAKINNYPILPKEKKLIINAVSKRKKEFSTGRWLSRRGLKYLGFPETEILTGYLRNPIWPDKINGSISHDNKLCAVVIMKKIPSLTNIGIDIIYFPKYSNRLKDLESMFVIDKDEIDIMNEFSLNFDSLAILFSIKESIIKAMSSEINSFIDMKDIKIFYENKKIKFIIKNKKPNVDIFAGVSYNYLITTAKIYN
ncbi:4-phosphopantetheinyl transferase, EntD homolog [Candidatus Profftella armatura (Diaphorina cf. continua)]|uniref:Enterobactin synthase component D n=1 Tax=Candidatus Profftella armatura (Diaphorina cf. continua) TaxID=2661583 RepID=A0A7R6W0G2_9PROT|nr:4'-phosphopantetheinyl transferase superfamily protein [Candidatus Profftella armatura (Diaphorina cf. continua)]BCG49557.1 4-phosphopantetheinyl transferase, EntD homolog [Candidatus Profftella armatura (Diaphorina cf. continua)]